MDTSSEPLTIRLVVIGDGSVGKTCMLLSYTTDKFPTDYVPTVFENYITTVQVDNRKVNLNLWDTAGQETYNQVRTLSYGQADVFLIVYSVVDKTSFDNVINKVINTLMQWFSDLSTEELAKIPKVVAGNKIDCRNDKSEDHMQFKAAKAILDQQNVEYRECSALTQDGLKEVFDVAVNLGYKFKQQQPKPQIPKQDQPEENNEKGCSCSVF